MTAQCVLLLPIPESETLLLGHQSEEEIDELEPSDVAGHAAILTRSHYRLAIEVPLAVTLKQLKQYLTNKNFINNS